jgi:hypothetical protein
VFRRTHTHALAAGAVALAALCTACGGSSSGGGSPADAAASSSAASSSAASSSAASSSVAPSSATPAPAAAAGGNPLDAEDFCAFLAEDAPKISAAGSPEGALAQLAGDLAFWIESHPEQKPRTAEDLDEVAATACPDVAKTVLTALETESFVDAFN